MEWAAFWDPNNEVTISLGEIRTLPGKWAMHVKNSLYKEENNSYIVAYEDDKKVRRRTKKL